MKLAQTPGVRMLIDLAVTEDLAFGDVTSEITIPSTQENCGYISAKQACVLAGQEIAAAVFRTIDSTVKYEILIEDGSSLIPGEHIARIHGNTRSILAAERLALNFLQRLSGIATASHTAMSLIAHTDCAVVDTRKTTPGWRILEKSAVTAGGGRNHRFSLGDGILIKDNHIQAVGSVSDAVKLARQKRRHPLLVEIEVKNFAEVDEAVEAGADALLLDNMSPKQIHVIAAKYRTRITLEASGNITLDNIVAYAEAGVHLISMGSLTHSSPAVDLSLNLE